METQHSPPPTAETRSLPDRWATVGIRRRRRLAALAEAQYGPVSRTELLDAGFSSTAIGRLIDDGTLHRKTHAVYTVGHPHLTPQGWWSLAVRVGGDGTLLAHRAACALRGLLRAVDATDVIVPQSRGFGLDFIRPHQAQVEEADRDVVHGLPVTGLGRTLIDIAGSEPRRLVEALEQAVILEVYDHAEMLDVLERHRGYRGVARLRAAIAELPDDPARFRSRTERRARDLLVTAGLPVPRINDWYVTGAGGGFELDLYWPGLKRNVEIDGPRHDLPWQQAIDRRRDAALQTRGVAVQRHRTELLDQAPQLFVAEVAAFLAETR
jgi:hypothetical protein